MMGFPPPPERRVTLDNWQVHPFNRWSFLHTREVLATASIDPGPGPALVLPSDSCGVTDVEVDLQGSGRTTIGRFLDHSWTDGFLVLHAGTIVCEAYRNGMTAETRHLAMSVSKSITSLLIGILVGRGLIDLDGLVTLYVPELAATAYDGAPVQHLLDMEVACDWLEDYLSEGSDFWRLDVACGWAPPRKGAAGTLLDLMRQFGRAGAHGERVQYLSPNADLLGLIAERVTGTRLPELLSGELWRPCGMELAGDLAVDRAGTAVADGGYCVALRDLARVGALVLQGGRVKQRQVVPGWWLEECRRAHPRPFHPTSFGADLPGASYHNQWWLIDGRTFALGIHGQMIAVDDDAEMVVVFLSSSPGPLDELTMQRQVVAALGGTFAPTS